LKEDKKDFINAIKNYFIQRKEDKKKNDMNYQSVKVYKPKDELLKQAQILKKLIAEEELGKHQNHNNGNNNNSGGNRGNFRGNPRNNTRERRHSDTQHLNQKKSFEYYYEMLNNSSTEGNSDSLSSGSSSSEFFFEEAKENQNQNVNINGNLITQYGQCCSKKEKEKKNL